ncbi:hypothetical protein SprV_0200877500 [Sparganum proliferum]
MSSDSTSQPIAGIHTFDLPSVWLGDIALWLRTVESRFALRQITREDTKFHYVVAALPMDIATDLRDIIDCPPTEAPYTALKEALISRISLSTQKRLQRLISEEDLGDRKPTQLLRRLEQLADGQKLDATMFKQLFLQRLLPSVQAILAPNIPSSTVQKLAETADRILEYYQPPVTVNVASRSTIATTMEDVVKRLDALTLEVSQLQATRGYNPPGATIFSNSVMRNLRATPPRASPASSFIPPDLDTCNFVWVRHDAVRWPLQPPYDGPYRILRRSDKDVVIDRNGKTDTVSIDRVKPAYIDDSDQSSPQHCTRPQRVMPPPPTGNSTPPVRRTRSGRHVHWPDRIRHLSFKSGFRRYLLDMEFARFLCNCEKDT